MKTIKTSELTGTALDWAVAKCEDAPVLFDGEVMRERPGQFSQERIYSPPTDWAQGGPIIEREKICIQCIQAGDRQGWWAIKDGVFHDRSRPDEILGPTPLIAAMRCYVASKLGDKIEIPEELAE